MNNLMKLVSIVGTLALAVAAYAVLSRSKRSKPYSKTVEAEKPSRAKGEMGGQPQPGAIPPGDEGTLSPPELPGKAGESNQLPQVFPHLPGHEEGQPTRTPIAPLHRGGRPRGPLGLHKEKLKEGSQQELKPEIICWKRERQWLVGVEVPEEYLNTTSGILVLQNGLPLVQDEEQERCWRLEQPAGEVVVRVSGEHGDAGICVNLGQRKYLLFKLCGEYGNWGRRVRFPSSGSYLVAVPDSWQRDEERAGRPLAAPEPVSLFGYQAHFFLFHGATNAKIAFRTPEGETVIRSKAPQFELVGRRVQDATESGGPLFGERPPHIVGVDGQAWESIGTVVIVEEARDGRERWRVAFRPSLGASEQSLPPEIAARGSGTYSLRFYGPNDELVESLAFRFVSGLREIQVPQVRPLPPDTGHQEMKVEVLHDSGCRVQAAAALDGGQVISWEAEKTTLKIPPHPMADETRLSVSALDGAQVEVAILAERVWWAVGDEEIPPANWKDRLIPLTRKSFAASSNQALWLRFPRQRWTQNSLIGFEVSRARLYSPQVTERTVAVPLRDFSDAPEVSQVGTTRLHLWLNGMTYEAGLCSLLVRAICKFCDVIAEHEESMLAHVGATHVQRLFTPLTYTQLRRRDPSLPPRIYKCAYCPAFVKSNDPTNPTSAIIRHIGRECQNVDRKRGYPRINFWRISDPDEIRANVIKTLPRVDQCALCGTAIEEATPDQKMEHLRQVHHRELYRLE